VLNGVETLLRQRGERSVHFIAAGHRLPDGVVQLDLPACLRSSRERRFYLVDGEAEDGVRPLHAKSLWFQRGDRALFCIGSSNFTCAGTGQRAHGPINLEANVAYVLPRATDDFAQVCSSAYPPHQPVSDDDELRFVVVTESSDDAEAGVPLPSAFGAALFRGQGDHRELALELVAAPPKGTRVSSAFGAVALPPAAGYPCQVTVPWREARPPSCLLVHWDDKTAIWPINVESSAALPPPEELRTLSLDELIEVLISARPVHEAVGRVVTRRAYRRRGDAQIEVDPHRKVDTRHFLLRRMRLLSAAFEQLRARLERPIYTHEALWWRLRGPLGPMALAHRLAIEDPASAAFQLAELALTLRDVRMEPRGDLSRRELREAIAAVVVELHDLAAQHPAPANLRAYVDHAFAELLP
jgi:hypothetical protein